MKWVMDQVEASVEELRETNYENCGKRRVNMTCAEHTNVEVQTRFVRS
jgi:hypothetical protein